MTKLLAMRSPLFKKDVKTVYGGNCFSDKEGWGSTSRGTLNPLAPVNLLPAPVFRGAEGG